MSVGDDLHPAAELSARSLSHVLNLLARRGMVLIASGQATEVELRLEGEDWSAVIGTVDRSVVTEGTQRGWLEACAHSPGRWRMNAAGRVALRKLKSASDEAMDGAHGRDVVAPDAPAAQPTPALTESPLAWLRRRKDKSGKPLISAAQFDAGERLRADLWFGDMTPRVTMNWSGNGAGGAPHGSAIGVDLLDRTVEAQQRVRAALSAAGPEFAGLLIDVCGHLKGLEEIELARGWPSRSGKVVLQLALNALVRHYGMISGSQGAAGGTLRHWASTDYKPVA